jgi:hypothetical protein
MQRQTSGRCRVCISNDCREFVPCRDYALLCISVRYSCQQINTRHDRAPLCQVWAICLPGRPCPRPRAALALGACGGWQLNFCCCLARWPFWRARPSRTPYRHPLSPASPARMSTSTCRDLRRISTSTSTITGQRPVCAAVSARAWASRICRRARWPRLSLRRRRSSIGKTARISPAAPFLPILHRPDRAPERNPVAARPGVR